MSAKVDVSRQAIANATAKVADVTRKINCKVTEIVEGM